MDKREMESEKHKDIMLKIANYLTKENVEKIKYCFSYIGDGILEEIKKPLKLIQTLEQQCILGVGNYTKFAEVLEKIGRSDLVKDYFNEQYFFNEKSESIKSEYETMAYNLQSNIINKNETIPESRINNDSIMSTSNVLDSNALILSSIFQNVAQCFVGTDWCKFAYILGLDAEIDMIDSVYHTTLEKSYQLLIKWRQKNGNVSWQQLKMNLESVERFDIIQKIKNDFPDIVTQPGSNIYQQQFTDIRYDIHSIINNQERKNNFCQLVGSDWKMLGSLLSIPDYILDLIEHDWKENKDKANKMLDYFFKLNDLSDQEKFKNALVQMNKLSLNEFIADCLNDDAGNIYYAEREYDKAIFCYRKSLKKLKLLHKDQIHLSLANSLNNLGKVYFAKGDYGLAIKYYEKNRNICKAIYKEEPHPNVANSFYNLGKVHSAIKEYDQAIKFYTDSLEMYKFVYKEKPDPVFVNCLNNLGAAYFAKGDYDRAIKYYEENRNICKAIYKEEPHQNVADSFFNLGNVYRSIQKYTQAIMFYKESIKIKNLIYQNQPQTSVAYTLSNIGISYYGIGQYDQAICYFTESLAIYKLAYKEKPNPSFANCLNNLGRAYIANRDFDQAIKCYEESVNMKILIYQDSSHPSVTESSNSLKRVYVAKRLYDQAIK